MKKVQNNLKPQGIAKSALHIYRQTNPVESPKTTKTTQNVEKVDFKLTFFLSKRHKAFLGIFRLKPPFRPLNPARGLKTEKRLEIVTRVNIPVGTSKPVQSHTARLFTALHM